MRKKALVLLSGGLESAALVAYLINKKEFNEIEALNIFYGQTNSKEQKSAKKIADYYNIPIEFMNLSKIFEISDCAMISKNNMDVSVENAKKLKATNVFSTKEKTFIPYRNGVFASVAATVAYSKNCNAVFNGVHGLNYVQETAYPDCSKKFIDAQSKAISYGTGGYVEFILPFRNIKKHQVLTLGLELKVPYELTWSCYTNNSTPCEKCFACIERKKAFSINNAVDPLEKGAFN